VGILKLRVSNRARITFGFAALGLAVVGTVGDAAPPPGATASARAFAARVVVPGQPGGTTPLVASPPAAQSAIASFSYPGDGSVVQTGAITVSTAATSAGAKANSSAGSDVSAVSLFRGEITADAVSGRAKAAVDDRSVGADVAGANVVNLVALGQQVQTAPGARVQLADWGYLDVLVQGVDTTAPKGLKAQRSFVTALDLHVTADHGGLPAGSEIQLGFAEATGRTAPEAQPKPPPSTTPTTGNRPDHDERANAHSKKPGQSPEAKLRKESKKGLTVTPELLGGPYVFPVFGAASFGDSFGGPRSDVSNGYHHGDDIFGQIGQPILAVADGTLGRATSSTTPTSPRIRRPRATARTSRPER
jgi:murein DD-endopeptidase MepM/ murein hydrolase activator NlpD